VRDTELYQHLLGIVVPWTVSRVALDAAANRVDVWTEHGKKARFRCPECNKECGLYDHDEERVWRHLDSCQFQTFLHARIPRVRCDEHGVKQARVPWAEPKSRFTMLFERLAIDVMMNMDIKNSARLLGLSWDEAHHIMERAVARGLVRRELTPPRFLGVDEKAIAKRHQYGTLLNDLEHGCVLEVSKDRRKESLQACFDSLGAGALGRVEAIAMDMWEPFIQTTRAAVPEADAKIVFDRFHIAKHLGEAVDQVRRAENRKLVSEGDTRLVGSKHLWLFNEHNVPERREAEFGKLKHARLKTARAWAIKEAFRDFWDLNDEQEGKTFFHHWLRWAVRSRLAAVKKAARMIERHLPNVLTYFKHRITNAASEGINAGVQLLSSRARGFRSFANFRVSILFRHGGLNLYPGQYTQVLTT
jgi:transposase